MLELGGDRGKGGGGKSEVSIKKFRPSWRALLARGKGTGRQLPGPGRGEPIAQIIPPPPPKRPESWLGSLSKTGKIIGDIVSPAVPEHVWDASRRRNYFRTRQSLF